MDLQLDKYVSLIELMGKMSWGAIPIWLALTIPTIYIVFTKALGDRSKPSEAVSPATGRTVFQQLRNWLTLPRLDKIVIYTSLALFLIGTVTLKVDQGEKERIRNVGLRMRKYCLVKNSYQISRNQLIHGWAKLSGVSGKDIDKVLELYPEEFIEVDSVRTIFLCEKDDYRVIVKHSERLLDNYLTNSEKTRYDIDELINYSPSFTREVASALIADSSHKYALGFRRDGNWYIAVVAQK